MDYTDYDTRLAAYAVIVDEQDRILLALWNEGAEPSWTLPGGGVDFEETPAQGAVRELKEETGYDVRLGPVLGVDVHLVTSDQRIPPSGRALKSIRVIHGAEIVGGELTPEIGGSTDRASWIPLAEVPDLPHVSLVDAGVALWRAHGEQAGTDLR